MDRHHHSSRVDKVRSSVRYYVAPVLFGLVLGIAGALLSVISHIFARRLNISVVGWIMGAILVFSLIALFPWPTKRILACMAAQVAIHAALVGILAAIYLP
ncbi:MAG: hypothetical protein JO055_09210 [Alphaproteobacteria bacterium]|nr:hypothetical protein [Alphaproteobacteria bacterium]